MSTLRFLVFALLAPVLLAGCGGATSSGTAQKPSPAASPESTSASANPEAGTSSIGGGGFPCSDRRAGGSPNLPAQLTDLRVARHDGFDRITFQFAPPAVPPAAEGPRTGVPTYSLEPRASAGFAKDPSGLPIQLDGAAGLRIVFRDTSSVDGSLASNPKTYTGSTDLKPRLPFVREVAQLGDFERVMSWGIGLGSPACLRLTELANPSRLAVDVRSMPASQKCPAPNPATQPTPRSASDQPGAPQTIAFIVGTVCSSSTGQPLAGATVAANLLEQSCQQGHQPWRCAASATTDSSGYYAIAVFSPGTYHLTVEHPGSRSGGGDVAVTGPGTFTASWPLG
jgi:carboxypeptidase family protein